MTSKAAAVPATAGEHHHHGHSLLENFKLGVWTFLASECLFFGSLIGTYLSLHGRSVKGPFPHEVFSIPMIVGATYTLLISSLTMVLAIAAIRQGKVRLMQGWLAATIIAGLVFLGFQATEYTEFIHEGLKLSTNIFSASFYTLTGFHGFHVSIGVIWLLGVLVNSFRGRITAEKAGVVESAGLYWHFVDMVWMVIFTVVYLMEFAR